MRTFCLTEPATSETQSTPEEHLARILRGIKSRVDLPEQSTPLAIHSHDEKFNPGPFYAAKYGKFTHLVEDIMSQIKSGKHIEEIEL